MAQSSSRKENDPMRRFSLVSFGTGMCATVTVAVAWQIGLLDLPEARSVDWRYQHARTTAEPLSAEIALVAIDDNSFNLLGRWPWPRRVLGEAISELARAGAGTVALDLLLSEPDADVGGDAALAAALRGLKSVVGVDIGRRLSLSAAWTTPAGRAELAALLAALDGEIDMDPAVAAGRAHLTEPRRRAFLEAPLEFKSLAIWHRVWALARGGEVPDLDEFLLALTGGRTVRAGADFDAVGRIDEIWERAQSWRVLQEELAKDEDPAKAPDGHIHEPPIPILAAECDGVGVATSDVFDLDGAKRHTGVAWDVPGGQCMQFGIAAAATHRGVAVDAIGITPDALVIGTVRLPLRDGKLFIDWPTSTFDGFPSVGGFDGGRQSAISIAGLVSLSLERAKLSRIEDTRDRARRTLHETVASFGQGALVALPLGEFASIVEDATLGDGLTIAERDTAQAFLSAFQSAQDGRVRLDEASARLRSMVEGKLVFLGWTATGALADQVPTPLEPNTPGVFVHAAIADMVLAGHARELSSAWVAPVATLGLGALASLLCATTPTLISTVGSWLLAVGWALVTIRLGFDSERILLPFVAPAAAPVASWATATAAVAVVTARDRARVTRQFAARVSPQLVAQLSRSPDALSVSGEEREITVIFGDLAGFTTIAEKLGGPEVVRTLNLYLGALADALVRNGAYVNKFLGDGFMAFWSAFGADVGQELRAAESAVACQSVIRELGKSTPEGAPRISLRLGIATGKAVVGDCGAPPKLNDYTAIGDVVNLSSRLESANKQFGTSILIDGATARGIDRAGSLATIVLRPLGRVVVVGQSVPVEVFEVVDAGTDPAWLAASGLAVSLFGEGKLAQSGAAWREFEAVFGASKISQLYLAAIAAGDGAVDGVLRLRAK